MPKPWEKFGTKKPWEVYQVEEPSIGEQVMGGLEAAAAIGSSAAAEIPAGLAGLATSLNPFAKEGAGGRRVEEVREALTYKPELPGAQAALQIIGETVEPVAKKLSEFEGTLGDYVMRETGSPELSAAATAMPTALIEILGLGTGRRAAKGIEGAADVAQAEKSALSEVTELEEATGIRQLTSDVIEPETRAAKFMQQQGELLEGGQRVAQQAERTKAIDDLLGNYEVTDAARFEQDIVNSVKRSIDTKKAALGELYESSTAQLDQMGDVPLTKSKSYAQRVIDKESLKGSLSDQTLITEMQDYLNAPDNLSFETVKSIRSAVGSKLKKAKQGAPVQGSSDTSMLSQLYSNLSNDMRKFADEVSPELADKWKEADKEFSGFATGTNKPGIKRLIKDGDATPEIVDQLLFSTKKSDLEFLNKNLDNAGKDSAKQRVIQQMMQKSSPDGIEINPNRFQTQMNKMRKQIDTFFSPAETEAIKSLKDALNQTRRAQDAAVTTQTGQQLVPLFAMANPLVLIPGVAQAIIERPMMRNLLIKRKAAKTASDRMIIDEQLQKMINESGLLGAATAGTITGALGEEQ